MGKAEIPPLTRGETETQRGEVYRLSSSMSKGGVSTRTHSWCGDLSTQHHTPCRHSGPQQPILAPTFTQTQHRVPTLGCGPERVGPMAWAALQQRKGSTVTFPFQETKVSRFSLAPSLPTPTPPHSLSLPCLPLAQVAILPSIQWGFLKYHPLDSAHCLDQDSRNL